MAGPVWELACCMCLVHKGRSQAAAQNSVLLEKAQRGHLTRVWTGNWSLAGSLVPPVWLCFCKCPICPSENATIGLKHFKHHEIIWSNCAAILWPHRLCAAHRKQPFLLVALFIFYTKSATTLVFEFVWNAKLDNDTRLRAALFLVNVLSTPLCLLLLGKVPFTLWRWLRTMGQIPWAVFCCFPHSGNCSQSQLFLEMTVTFAEDGWNIFSSEGACWHVQTGGNTMVRKMRLCAFGFSAGSVCRLFICHLTNFIFSHCGITISCWSISLTQMGDKDPLCHRRAGCVFLLANLKSFKLSKLWTFF